MSGDAETALARYRETLMRWDEASEANQPDRANSLFDESHELFKLLRDEPGGRTGISRLMGDADPYVRSTAAAHSLLWTPETALPALEALEQDDSVPPRVRISAKYTASEWRAGRLSLDWETPR